MLISWNWLNRYIDLDGLDPQEVGESFTLKVAELDDVYPIGQGLEGVRTARVTKVVPHLDAKKLSIVEIDDGEDTHTLICGAPNVRNAVGNVVAWVQPGTHLPNGMQIDVAEIRGIVSHGMLASEEELGLSDENEGIWVLPAATPIGCSLSEAVPIKDWVWEVDNKAITHRADLWGHLGIAREISMLTGRNLRHQFPEIQFGEDQPVAFNGNLPDGCHRYLCTRIDNISVEPSPIWLQRLLVAAGIRPISNVVDLTNFVMLETGNPLHAFDSANLSGGQLSVVKTESPQRVVTLDEQERTVEGGTLLICDGGGPVAVAGVMGCLNSQISDDTSSLTLESACFDAEMVRKSSIKLGLRTESSARFEKALSPEMAHLAALSFCSTLSELCPAARFNSRLIDAFPAPPAARQIELSMAYARQRLGVELLSQDAERIFKALGLHSQADGDTLTIDVPYWRAGRDLQHQEDLVEELGRSIGYYAIEPKAPSVQVARPVRAFSKTQERVARRLLSMEGGFNEVLSYAFAHGPTAKKLLGDDIKGLELANPISTDWQRMRMSLAPNLLKMAVENRRYFADLKLFEMGRIFEPTAEGLAPQPRRLGLVSVHGSEPAPLEANLVHLRRLVGRYLDALNYSSYAFEAGIHGFDHEAQWMHPNRSLTLSVNNVHCGYLGTLHPRIARSFPELGKEVWLGELDLDRLGEPDERIELFKAIPKYPSIPFDLSLEVPVSMRSAALIEKVKRHFADCEIFETVRLFSVFHIDDARKSLSLRFSFRSLSRSLSDDEVNPLIDAFLEHFQAAYGIGLRME